MAVVNEPTKWNKSLVNSGDANAIPDDTTAGTGDFSFEEGFPQITQVPLGAGGIAPDRKDFNGVFKLLGAWIYYTQNGGVPSYNADYDYIAGRVVLYNGNIYKCIKANGISSTVVAPDSVSPLGSDYWVQFANIDFTNINNTAKIAIAHNAMPSSVFDNLTLGANNTQYTAPADGYFQFTKQTNGSGQYIQLQNYTTGLGIVCVVGNLQTCQVYLPVQKGDKVLAGYNAGGTTVLFRFIYAVGSESEQ